MTSKDSMNWIEDLDWLDKNLGHWIHMYTSGLSTARIKQEAGRAIKEHFKIAEVKGRIDEVKRAFPDKAKSRQYFPEEWWPLFDKYIETRTAELESQLKELSDE